MRVTAHSDSPAAGAGHYLPFRKADLVQLCLQDSRLTEEQRAQFRHWAALVAALLHHEFHELLERLKDAFDAQQPDASRRPLPDSDAAEPHVAGLAPLMQQLLVAANYQPITREDLEQALQEASLFNVRLAVDFDDFDELVFYRRGIRQKTETVRHWFGLRAKQIEFSSYDRVLVYARFKSDAHFAAQRRGELLFTPGATVLKLFQKVPKADLEMLFPNTEVRMRLQDKLLIGVPAAVGSVAMVVTKLSSTLLLLGALLAFWLGMRDEPVRIDQAALLTLAAGLGTLGAYLFRQFGKFKNRKIRFMKALTDNLYFRNLDSDAGVFHRLLDEAEDQECKEVLLAYFALLLANEPLAEEELDRWVERWFHERCGAEVDFEVDDAVAKLRRWGLLVDASGGKLTTLPLDQALQTLDARWDGLYDFS